MLFALWDGSAGSPDGCGTAEVVAFAIHGNPRSYLLEPQTGLAVWSLVTSRLGATIDSEIYKICYIIPDVDEIPEAIRVTELFNADAARFGMAK